MIWAKITKIDKEKKSRDNGSKSYFYVFFKCFDDQTKITWSAATTLVREFRNFGKWREHLEIGAVFKGVYFKDSGKKMIDTDSPIFFAGTQAVKEPSQGVRLSALCVQIDAGVYSVIGSHGKRYTVKNSVMKGWECECESYRFSRARDCKHCQEVRRLLKKAAEIIGKQRQNNLF